MKQYLLIFFIGLSINQVKAQSKYIDSLKHELVTAKEDSNKVKLYTLLGGQYFFNQPDTAIFYGQQALQLSQKIKFKAGEVTAYFTLWVPYFSKGEYAKALDYAYKQLHLYEDWDDEKNIAATQMAFANIYREQGDLGRALAHILICKKLYEKLHLLYGDYAINIHGNLALIYEQTNQLDSAFVHAQIALDTATRRKRKDTYIMVINTAIGDVYRKRKNYTNALEYYQKALPNFILNNNTKNQITTSNSIGECYWGLGKIDSALLFAKNAYRLLQPGSFIKGGQQTAELLAKIYKAKGISDSAIIYLELSMALKDSLYSQAKEREIQNISFEEQQREQQQQEADAAFKRRLWTYGILTGFIAVLIFAGILWRNNRQKQKANKILESTLADLKSTQQQLIQSEKMASLGELTAGIAHEIQNPLNFVNNFSEVNNELIEEVKSQKSKLKSEELDEILNDIFQNNEKINHHGKRADGIVKGMLQHSRTSSGTKELTDVNALTDEYLRLAYHGLRAKDKSFNAKFETDFDNSIGKINIVPQDMGRVILNLINNAFYAVSERQRAKSSTSDADSYEPKVIVTTKRLKDKIEINVKDNGNGIPQNIIEKIFQPFFTTKPTGQGTGLGLSLSYDIIIKGHGGELKVKTKEGEGSEFVIELPIK